MPDSPLEPDLHELVERAKQVRANAYAPYSNYLVGAALRTKGGRVFTGVNVENASYGLTICAERAAVAAAVAAGVKRGEIEAIAVVTRDGGSPCGACRQFLYEFGDFPVVLAADDAKTPPAVHSVAELLPLGFEFSP